MNGDKNMINIYKNLNYFKLKLIKDIDENKIDQNTKLELIDEEGYKYYLSNTNLANNKTRGTNPSKFYHNNIFTNDNIKLYIIKSCGDSLKIISDIPNNSKIKFKLYCNIHYYEFERTWDDLLKGYFCPICNNKNYKKPNLNLTIEKVKELAKPYGINIVSKHYKDNQTKLAFICNKHKEKGIQYKNWNNILHHKHPCRFCAAEAISKANKITNEEFVEKFKSSEKYNEFTLLGKYISSNTNIKVKCKKCGYEFSLRPDHIIESCRCLVCNPKSLGEQIISELLDSFNIYYIREYRYNDCRDINPLPFDFYLPDFNYCIEFDGKQHFEPSNFSDRKDEKSAINNFKIIQLHDNIKNNYCKENNIKLIRIPYWKINNIKDILIKELEIN